MTNLEALEKLYISLGGVESDLEDVNTTAEVIDLIKDVAGGDSKGGIFSVQTEYDGDKATLNASFNDIVNAVKNSMLPVNFYYDIDEDEVYADVSYLVDIGSVNNPYATFAKINPLSDPSGYFAGSIKFSAATTDEPLYYISN